MGEDKNKIEYDIQTTLDDCIEKLEGILNGLKSREILLRNRSDAVDLHPTPIVFLTVKAKQKGAKESLTIELGWKADQHLSARDDGFQIGRRDN
ncbi:MAG TPA: amphi-Trp domain-containing protein [Polyangiaceae bacterium]|nr:amphi-Trp domain-containing protein [Polyangiaceae bacterium]